MLYLCGLWGMALRDSRFAGVMRCAAILSISPPMPPHFPRRVCGILALSAYICPQMLLPKTVSSTVLGGEDGSLLGHMLLPHTQW